LIRSVEHLPSANRLEGVLEVFDGGLLLVRWPSDSDDVEAGAVFKQVVAAEVTQRDARQAALFVLINGFGGMATVMRRARLDLDEDNRLSVDGDEIDFANSISLAMCDNDVSLTLQEASSGSLAPNSQRLWRGPTRNAVTKLLKPRHVASTQVD